MGCCAFIVGHNEDENADDHYVKEPNTPGEEDFQDFNKTPMGGDAEAKFLDEQRKSIAQPQD